MWLFDVPPTPHTATSNYVYTAAHAPPPDGLAGAYAGYSGPRAVAVAAGTHDGGGFKLRDRLRLGDGCHQIQAWFVSAPTGLAEGRVAETRLCAGQRAAVAARVEAKVAGKDAELLELRRGYERLARQHTLLHPELNHTWREDDWLHHDLLQALRGAGGGGGGSGVGNSSGLSSIATRVEGAVDVYVIPLFSDAFMVLLEEELAHAQQQSDRLTWTRPNTMNNYGFVLEELGLQGLLHNILRRVLAPLASAFLPAWGGAALDSEHTFTIRLVTWPVAVWSPNMVCVCARACEREGVCG